MASFNAVFKEKNGDFVTQFGQTQMVSTDDYEKIFNKPSIEGNVLIGDKTFSQLGLDVLTPQDVDDIIYGGD